MKTQPTTLVLALATALGTLAVSPVHALVMTTASVAFTGTNSVKDLEGGGSTTFLNAPLGTSSISQFNAATGVLMGATLNLTSTRTPTITVTAAANSGAPNDGNRTTSGTGNSIATLSAPGVNNAFGTILASGSCTGKQKTVGCTNTTSPGVTSANANLAVGAAGLSSYVGGSTITATRTSTLTATQSNLNTFFGEESTTYGVTWAGTIGATYDYKLHAAPSFDGSTQLTLDLDFGTVVLGSMTDMGFSIFNAAGDRVGLDLDSILASGDTSQLSTNLPGSFAGLGAGSDLGYLASFNASSLGPLAAAYILSFSDADVGEAASRLGGYTLTLNLTGNVVKPQTIGGPAGVPEPGMLALLGVGLFGLGMSRRKRH